MLTVILSCMTAIVLQMYSLYSSLQLVMNEATDFNQMKYMILDHINSGSLRR